MEPGVTNAVFELQLFNSYIKGDESSLSSLQPFPIFSFIPSKRFMMPQLWQENLGAQSYPNPLQNCHELGAGRLTMELQAQTISRSSPVNQQPLSRGGSWHMVFFLCLF